MAEIFDNFPSLQFVVFRMRKKKLDLSDNMGKRIIMPIFFFHVEYPEWRPFEILSDFEIENVSQRVFEDENEVFVVFQWNWISFLIF